MLSKSLRGFLSFVVTAGLLSWGYFGIRAQTQDPTNKTALGVNASALATGPIYTQPIDPSGRLLISSWLDPDGSDFDQYIWDNFTLSANETIIQIDWIGGYDPTRLGLGGPVVDFTVAIYPSIAAGSEPAVANPPLVTYQTGDNASETSIGTVGGTPMYAYTFILPTSFNASAGVKYWVQIEAWQHGSLPDWGLALATGGDGNHFRRYRGAGGDIQYHAFPGDAAFTLLPDAPTDISLSNNFVDENQPFDTVIGALDATDPIAGATFTFSLACAVTGVDDGSFNISGVNLRTSASFDFETQNTFNVCIRVINQGGLTFDKNFVIFVNDINETPTDISLSNDSVDENQPINTLVGTLDATDPDAGATFTFSLACEVAGADDASFNINGTNLQTSVSFNFAIQSAYNICIHVTDEGGLTFDKDFIVTVNNVIGTPTDTATSTASNTATETPTDTATPTASNTPTMVPTDTATPTASHTATNTPTDTATPTSTNTPTSTATDTATPTASNTPTNTATDIPSDTATPTATLTPTSTPTNIPTPLPNIPGRVTGGGNIDLASGKATFGFVVRYAAGDSIPSGNLTFNDHNANIVLKATAFKLLYIEENHALITGVATVNDQVNVAFTLIVGDSGEPGSADIFIILIPALNEYSAGGLIAGGNIQISIP